MGTITQSREAAAVASFKSTGFVKVRCYPVLEDELQYLRTLLQNAMGLEHATIPPYLTMLYTLNDQIDWYVMESIRSIVVEEMLHFVLAANVLNAIGGTPKVNSPSFLPRYPSYLPYNIDGIKISLLGFSKAAVAQGMQIEHPKYIRPEVVARQLLSDMTIGEFYTYIEGRLRSAVEQFGEDAIFCGDPALQVPPHAFYYDGGGGVVLVNDLPSAISALRLIKAQGEGTNQEEWTGKKSERQGGFREVAHYFRFNELKEGRLYQEGDTVKSGPTGEPLVVNWDNSLKVPDNVKLWDYPPGEEKDAVYAFNQRYCQLLEQLQQALTGEPEKLLPAVVAMCSLRNDFRAITENPFPGQPGFHCVPTFEYVPPQSISLESVTSESVSAYRMPSPSVEKPSVGGCPFGKAKAMTSSQTSNVGNLSSKNKAHPVASSSASVASGSVQETLDRLQQAYATGNLNLALSCMTPDVIWDITGPSSVPYTGIFYGHTGFSRFWTLLNETVSFGSAGGDFTFIQDLQAMTYGGEQGTTKAGGVPYHYEWAIRYQFNENYQITLMRQYFDPSRIAAALQDLPYKDS